MKEKKGNEKKRKGFAEQQDLFIRSQYAEVYYPYHESEGEEGKKAPEDSRG